MKKFITTNTGGHLLSLNDFAHIQQAYQEAFEAVARGLLPAGTQAAILHGCELTVNAGAYTVTAGAIYYQGEIYLTLPGSGSTAGNDLFWELDVSFAPLNPVRYETGNTFNVHEIRQLRLQQGSGLVAHHTLQRVGQLFAQTLDYNFIRNQIFEVGDIRIFRGSLTGKIGTDGLGVAGTKWQGWALADGRNGTADLKGRFVVGLDTRTSGADGDYNQIGKTGGSKEVTLNSSQLPSHEHPYGDIYYAEAGGTVTVPGNRGSGDTDSDNRGFETPRTTGSTGGNQAHENRPPYYVVAYIEKIA